MKNVSVKVICEVAILIALNVALGRLLALINSPYVRVSIGFLPIAVCGMLFGPVWAAVAAAIGDVIGALLFPTGDIFLGFTVTAALFGFFFGLFLYNKKVGVWQVVPLIFTNCIGLSIVANTMLIHLWYGVSLAALLPSRFVQGSVTAVAYLILIPIVDRTLIPRLKKMAY